MSFAVDNRQVVLLKSLRTNNRFYTLVEPESGFKNADAIDEFPEHLPLGIAYPCLEDGLNDFAVIRTTFETLDCFPDDEELRNEMMLIIDDARGNLVRRLVELRERIVQGQAHFLGTDLYEFKESVVHMATRGSIRRTLDNMMKVDVFESVGKAEAARHGGPIEPMYRYEFLPTHSLPQIEPLEPRAFIGRLFDDVLDAVTNDGNYADKSIFDRNVFQKFIAVMFVNYATTDPMFYGTNRADYGVSSDRDMNETPLYQAVGRALRDLERGVDPWTRERNGGSEPAPAPRAEPETRTATAAPVSPAPEPLMGDIFGDVLSPEELVKPLEPEPRTVEIPFGAAEHRLLEPLSLLAEAVKLLEHVDGNRAQEVRSMTVTAAEQIFAALQDLGVVSPLAANPVSDTRRP